MFSVTKSYRDLPAAHRQPKHTGHCRLIHGHNWGFDIEFMCAKLDDCGFVVDVGSLSSVREMLKTNFDHTLLLNEDDPYLNQIHKHLAGGPMMFANIIVVANCGMEGLAKYVHTGVQSMIHDTEEVSGKDRGLFVYKVTCWEDSKNSATYCPE